MATFPVNQGVAPSVRRAEYVFSVVSGHRFIFGLLVGVLDFHLLLRLSRYHEQSISIHCCCNCKNGRPVGFTCENQPIKSIHPFSFGPGRCCLQFSPVFYVHTHRKTIMCMLVHEILVQRSGPDPAGIAYPGGAQHLTDQQKAESFTNQQ